VNLSKIEKQLLEESIKGRKTSTTEIIKTSTTEIINAYHKRLASNNCLRSKTWWDWRGLELKRVETYQRNTNICLPLVVSQRIYRRAKILCCEDN
jgi:hypothetical protein